MTIPTPITTPSVLVYLSLNVLIEAKKKSFQKSFTESEKKRGHVWACTMKEIIQRKINLNTLSETITSAELTWTELHQLLDKFKESENI